MASTDDDDDDERKALIVGRRAPRGEHRVNIQHSSVSADDDDDLTRLLELVV